MRVTAAVLLASCAFTGAAHAGPGGTSGVSGPTISEGQTKVEFRTAAFDGGAADGAWEHRAQVGHAFTDWWRPTMIARAVDDPTASLELESIAIENLFDIVPTRHWPVHFGALIEAEFGVSGNADSVELKLLAERVIGPVTLRFNVEGERDIGSGASDEWAHEYSTRANWDVNDTLAIGLEGFGDFDESAHAWGPRAQVKFGHAAIALSYLEGFDTDADRQFRLALEFTP